MSSACSRAFLVFTSSPSLTEEISGYEQQVGGPLRQPAHKVGIPVGPKRNINPHPIAGGYQRPLQVAAHAVKHLKFELVRLDPAFFCEAAGGVNHVFVVGGDAMVETTGEQDLHQPDKVFVHVRLVWERQVGRL